MWEYVSWTLPAGTNAWNHVAGWPARPWGQCSTVAKPDSLQPLRDIGVSQETIYGMVDSMFHINDSSCPHLRSTSWEPPTHHPHRESILQKRAQCRSFVEAVFSSMLMYYKERCWTSTFRWNRWSVRLSVWTTGTTWWCTGAVSSRVTLCVTMLTF